MNRRSFLDTSLKIDFCLLSFVVISFAFSGDALTGARYSFKRSAPNAAHPSKILGPGLEPKYLFLCAAMASKISAEISVCERSLEVQQQAYQCTSRILLTVKIDHELAFLERAVAQLRLGVVKDKTVVCEQRRHSESEGATLLKEHIDPLEQELDELQKRARDMPLANTKLAEIRDAVAESNARRKETHISMRKRTEQLTQAIKISKNKVKVIASGDDSWPDQQSEDKNGSRSLQTCNENLADVLSEQLKCTSQTLPGVKEQLRQDRESLQRISAHYKTVRSSLTQCQAQLELCRRSEECENLQNITEQNVRIGQQRDQVQGQLDSCNESLAEVTAGVHDCEDALALDRERYHTLLINVTGMRFQEGEINKKAMECEQRLSICQENLTSCEDYSAMLAEKISICLRELDKWKFKTELCDSEATMLWENINATSAFMAEMRDKLVVDQKKLNMCHDRQLFYRSGNTRTQHALVSLTPKLAAVQAIVSTCHDRCPRLKPPPPTGHCPPSNDSMRWHDLPSGCFLVTRPGAAHDRMAAYCGRQAANATIVRLASRQLAKDAYAVLMGQFFSASRSSPLRTQRRAWVDLVDGFEFPDRPTRSYQCSASPCDCWTMRFSRRGRSQRYSCDYANLPAICHVAHA